MSPRPRRELERLPHRVYVHFDKTGTPIYVGRTAHPDERPWDDRAARAWIATESHDVQVSPEMPFGAARWMERVLIDAMSPRHNRRRGERDQIVDWRIDRICEAEGVPRSSARAMLPYYPADPEAFEEYLAKRVASVAQFYAEAEARGISADRLAMERLDAVMQIRPERAS